MDSLKNWVPLNFAILANPVNWIIVFLMIAIAGVALSLVFTAAKEPAQ